MAATVSFVDARTRDDLRVFLQRLSHAGEPEVRVSVRGVAFAVFGCTQAPRTITDSSPVVLVMRAFELAHPPASRIDTTVQARSLLDRLARSVSRGGSDDLAEGFADPASYAATDYSTLLELPDVTTMATWAGMLPPFTGWRASGAIDAASVRRVAEEGIRRVAEALPEHAGDAVVHRVRATVWGGNMAPGLPAAAAFASEAMGFLKNEDHLTLWKSRTWTRMTSAHGHVLVHELPG